MTAPDPNAIGLKEARRLGEPGRCLFCPQKLPPGKRIICGSEECTRRYRRAWHKDNQKKHPERYGRDFYAARQPRPPSPPPTAASTNAPPSPFTPTTELLWIPGRSITYAELCRRFDRRYGKETRTWDKA